MPEGRNLRVFFSSEDLMNLIRRIRLPIVASMRHWRRQRIHLLTLALPVLLGMGLLELYYPLHLVLEPDCAAQESGQDIDCFICSSHPNNNNWLFMS